MCTRQNSQCVLQYEFVSLYELLFANNWILKLNKNIYLLINYYEIDIKTIEEAFLLSNGDTGLGKFGDCASFNEWHMFAVPTVSHKPALAPVRTGEMLL